MYTVNIFAETDIEQYFEKLRSSMRSKIQFETEQYILNVNEDEYIKHLVSENTLEGIDFRPSALTATPKEVMVPAEDFPGHYNVRPGRRYSKQAIRFHLPFTGNAELLHCIPNPRFEWSMEVEMAGSTVDFEMINWDNNPDTLRSAAQQAVSLITSQAEHVVNNVEQFNRGLEGFIRSNVQARKQSIHKKSEFLEGLGIPIRKKADIPKTFSIPAPEVRKKIVVAKPTAVQSALAQKPEPTLDEATYRSILKIMLDVGKQFERMPSTYKDKSEEDIRDHFLLFLEPNFEGSATGETFNKAGKTDILLRYQGKNVFIAECKFWKGLKSYLSTITQLLSYLTWRDSKAAVVIFVENKDLSSVIAQIHSLTSQHPCFVKGPEGNEQEGILFQFHLPDDVAKFVSLTVLIFHFPIEATAGKIGESP